MWMKHKTRGDIQDVPQHQITIYRGAGWIEADEADIPVVAAPGKVTNDKEFSRKQDTKSLYTFEPGLILE